jgi:hypothetical protein
VKVSHVLRQIRVVAASKNAKNLKISIDKLMMGIFDVLLFRL